MMTPLRIFQCRSRVYRAVFTIVAENEWAARDIADARDHDNRVYEAWLDNDGRELPGIIPFKAFYTLGSGDVREIDLANTAPGVIETSFDDVLGDYF